MGFAVYHTAKGKSSGTSLGHHIDRTEGKEKSFKNADVSRTHLNVEFAPSKYTDLDLSKAVDLRISEGFKGKRKIRTDAVKYITHVLTGTHQNMIDIFTSKEKANAWIKANLDFIKKEFGAENIVRFSLHLDEKTPHIHAVTVPLTSDGRLSAKEVIGNRIGLELRQDRYAEQMQSFGLERGLKNSRAKHKTTAQYQKEVARAEKTIPFQDDIDLKTDFLGRLSEKKKNDIQKSFDKLKNALIESKVQNNIKAKSLKEVNSRNRHLELAYLNNKEQIKELQEDIYEINQDILKNPLNLEIRKAQLQEIEQKKIQRKQQKEQERNRNKGFGFSR